MSFINEEIVKNILNSGKGCDNITVIGHEIKDGIVKEGGSEGSQLVVRYQKDGKTCKNSYVLKTFANLPLHGKVERKGLCQKEIHMYESVLPKFYAALPIENFVPRHYYVPDKSTLIIEDLSQSGYTMKEQCEQLDFEHSVVALKCLAKFHAISVKVDQTTPEILDQVREDTIFTSQFFLNDEIRSKIETHFSKVIGRADPSYAETYADALSRFRNQFLSSAKDELKPKAGSFNVLNHGDLWINNIFFKYDQYHNVEHVKFVDFQTCRWCSPATDIVYFVTNCVRFEIFEKYFDLLLEIYADTLNKMLKYLECDRVYRVEDLREDISRIYHFWVYTLIVPTPVVVSEPGTSLKSILDDELLDGERYVDLSKKWISYFIQNGVFVRVADEVDVAVKKFITKFQELNNVKVTKHKLDNDVVKEGNNFSSGIVGLKVEYEDGTQTLEKSVLMKIPSKACFKETENRQEIDVFGKEIYIYQHVLSHIHKMWRGEPFSATCYVATDSKVIVLEDLRELGYRTEDKKTLLDLDHSKLALRNLAQFHGVSVKCLKEGVVDESEITFKNYLDMNSPVKDFYIIMYNKFLDIMADKVPQTTYEKLKGHKDHVWEAVVMGMEPNDEGLNVILHGDYWLNNIMFLHDDQGRVLKSKMVDFQLSRIASPAVDLLYFFVISSQFDVFKKHRKELLSFYLETLNDTFKLLNCDCKYTLEDLIRDMYKHKRYFLHMVGVIFRLLFFDKKQIFDAEAHSLSPEYVETVLKWVNYLDQENFL